MRYGPISPELFIQNRRNFTALLPPASLAIFHSNDIMPTNADGTMAFRQNNDLFYLAGVDQEESILVIFPDAVLPQYREILFLKETSEHILVWEGYKLTKDEARAQLQALDDQRALRRSGVKSVHDIGDDDWDEEDVDDEDGPEIIYVRD